MDFDSVNIGDEVVINSNYGVAYPGVGEVFVGNLAVVTAKRHDQAKVIEVKIIDGSGKGLSGWLDARMLDISKSVNVPPPPAPVCS